MTVKHPVPDWKNRALNSSKVTPVYKATPSERKEGGKEVSNKQAEPSTW